MENEVKKREIDYLWHFTRIENLEAILHKGLVPRGTLEAEAIQVTFNDQYRMDGYRDANCLSIGHPNYKMFWSLRQQYPEQEWVVIVVKSKVLWLKDCAFCYENAASNNVRSIPLQQRKGLQAFQKLFEPDQDKPDRATIGLPDSCPTNPQAEILIFDVIEPEFIYGAITPNKNIENELKEKYSGFDFLYHRAFYSARLDHRHW